MLYMSTSGITHHSICMLRFDEQTYIFISFNLLIIQTNTLRTDNETEVLHL